MLNNLLVGKYGKHIPAIQTFVDIIIVAGAYLVLINLNDSGRFFVPGESLGFWRVAFTPLLVAAVIASFTIKVHQRRMMRAERLFSIAFALPVVSTLLYAALMMLTGFYHVSFRFFVFLYFSQVVPLFLTWIVTLLVLKKFRRGGSNIRNIVIIGTGHAAMRLTELLTQEQGYGMRVLGYFDNRLPSDFNGKFLGPIDRLEDFVKENDVHEIFCTSSIDNDVLVNKVIYLADQHFCKLYFTPLMSPKLQHSFYMYNFNSAIPAIAVHQSPLRSVTNRAIKRAFDIVFSLCALMVLPIVFIPVAIAIKLTSPGPIFFKQLRTGYLGKDFYCYKFRTMRVSKDADTRQATKDDIRKTKLGNFLRHTSIDELPQFWNVLKGDMSVVGPRPHMLAHTEEYRKLIDQYMVRHLVKPGITGWAQIQGFRGATDELWQMERRVDNDVWYIEHWSLSLDIKIIVRTVTNALSGEENAY